MKTTGIKALTLACALQLASASAFAQEPAPITFTNINDAVPNKFFDAATTQPDPADPNVLVIGFNSGRDPVIWKDREFKASLTAFSYQAAADTISFVITAPAGYFISAVIYKESVIFGNSRQGRGFATTQLVVNGLATEEHFVDLLSTAPTSVPMSITTSLVAANADVKVVAGRVVVGLEPLAQPPSLAGPEALVELPGDIVPMVAEEEPLAQTPSLPEPEALAELPGDIVVVDIPPPGGEGSAAI